MSRTLDDSALLELVGEIVGVLDLDELRPAMLTALRRVIPSEWTSLNEFGPERVVSIVEPELDPAWIDRFAELAHENPLVPYFQRTGDGRARRFSDVITRHELESTRLYREFYARFGVNHQIAFTLPSQDETHLLGISLNRGDPDFSDAERDFLNRARPFLIQAYRSAVAYSERAPMPPAELEAALVRAGLTRRESEVVALVALGGSNRDIGRRLGVSDRTAQKHLERAFRKLGVEKRSEAAARAWELAGS